MKHTVEDAEVEISRGLVEVTTAAPQTINIPVMDIVGCDYVATGDDTGGVVILLDPCKTAVVVTTTTAAGLRLRDEIRAAS